MLYVQRQFSNDPIIIKYVPFNMFKRKKLFVSVRTALLAIIGFMPTHGNGAIGSLDYSPDERKVLARR